MQVFPQAVAYTIWISIVSIISSHLSFESAEQTSLLFIFLSLWFTEDIMWC